MYFADWMKISDLMDFFEDFYEDFDRKKAEGMCETLKINTNTKIKSLSKGNKEKVQLALVMSRKAELYLLDEPIADIECNYHHSALLERSAKRRRLFNVYTASHNKKSDSV